MSPKLSASLMCANLVNLERDIQLLEENGVDYLHIDIMDAIFVPSPTFGPDVVNSVRKIINLPLDIHLLMERPCVVVRSMDIRKGDIVNIHSECRESIMENAIFIKQKKAQFGLALNPDTSIEEVKKYLPYVDVILLMLIIPGFAGSSMIHGIMEKVREIRQHLDQHSHINIEVYVDGSVSCERARYTRNLGASIFVGRTAGVFRKDMPLNEAIPTFIESMT